MSTALPDSKKARWPKALLWLAAATAVAVSIWHLGIALPNHSGLGHVSGAWTALAIDAADGTVYRPLFSETGYGGTRFLPLHFLLHGLLIRAGLPVLWAGYLIGLAAMAALMAGAYRLMRILGTPVGLAAPVAILVLSPMTSQHALTAIRGDSLAAALNVWGLVCCAPAFVVPFRKPAILAAAMFFSLAFAAKITTVFGLGAGVVALYLGGDRKPALRLLVLTAAGMLAVLAATQLVSGGRALEVFSVCASGGTNWQYIAMAPVHVFRTAASSDSLSLVLLILALGGILGMGRRRWWRDLTVLSLIASVGVLCVIMGSPGTDYNHFIDVAVLGLVLIGVRLARRDMRIAWAGALAVAAIGILLAWMTLSRVLTLEEATRDRHRVLELVKETGSPDRPVLSESPLIPILAGRRPYMVDPFMFRLMGRTKWEAVRQMERQLEEGYFAAIVLFSDPATARGRHRLETVHFGKKFTEHLLRYYQETERYGEYVIFRPRGLSPPGG